MKTPDKTLLKYVKIRYDEIKDTKQRGYLSIDDELDVAWDRDLKRRPLTVRWYYSPETGLIYHGRS